MYKGDKGEYKIFINFTEIQKKQHTLITFYSQVI